MTIHARARNAGFAALDLETLDLVSGGLNLKNIPESENIEDRRPQSHGGPVPDEEWQADQDRMQHERDTTCTEQNPYGDGSEPEDDSENDDQSSSGEMDYGEFGLD